MKPTHWRSADAAACCYRCLAMGGCHSYCQSTPANSIQESSQREDANLQRIPKDCRCSACSSATLGCHGHADLPQGLQGRALGPFNVD